MGGSFSAIPSPFILYFLVYIIINQVDIRRPQPESKIGVCLPMLINFAVGNRINAQLQRTLESPASREADRQDRRKWEVLADRDKLAYRWL